MKKIYSVGFLGLVTSLMVACAPPYQNIAKEATLPEIDVLAMKENTDAAIKIARQNKLDMDAMNSRVTELERIVIDLRNSIQSLPMAKMDEYQTNISLLRDEVDHLKQLIENKDRVVTFSPSGKVRKKESSLAQQPASFQKGILEYQKRDFSSSIATLQKFVLDNPNDSYAPDAYFWIGEANFSLGDYARSVAAYQRVFTFLNAGNKADNAQFKLGMSYLRLGDANQASSEFRKLEVIYPNSEFLDDAKKELKKMGY
jgi:tol-pal system protein YbgF